MKKVICMGEALIDWIPSERGLPLRDVPSFRRACGGAPANCAAAVAKLGGRAELYACVGEDAFGDYILYALEEAGVGISHIQKTDAAHTTLAFAALGKDGSREFSFCRRPGADMFLNADGWGKNALKDAGIFHFGSLGLSGAVSRRTHEKALAQAFRSDVLISFDPNIRLSLWSSPEMCRKTVLEFLPMADIIKVSEEELPFLTQIKDEEAAIQRLLKMGPKWVLYSMGKRGAGLITKNGYLYCDSVDVPATDTTGAGDACMGSLLFCLARSSVHREALLEIPEEDMRRMLEFAVAYSTCSVMHSGAIPSYGSYEKTIQFIKEKMRHGV